jgi:hypothetical protein
MESPKNTTFFLAGAQKETKAKEQRATDNKRVVNMLGGV